jgi:hypothetical protein
MKGSGLDELVTKEEELFNIIDFCSKAVDAMGDKYTIKDYGPNSSTGPEVKGHLEYHNFDISIHYGFSGAYGEWDNLKVRYKGQEVLDVRYFGSIKGNGHDYKVVSTSKNKKWRNALLELASDRVTFDSEKKAYDLQKARETKAHRELKKTDYDKLNKDAEINRLFDQLNGF